MLLIQIKTKFANLLRSKHNFFNLLGIKIKY